MPVHKPLTMFWPTDKALNSLSAERQQWLFSPDHQEELSAIVKAHIIRNSKVGGAERGGKYSFLAKTWLPLSAILSHTLMSSARASIHCPATVGWGTSYAGYIWNCMFWSVIIRHWLPAIILRKRHRTVLLSMSYILSILYMDTTTQCSETFKRLADHSFVNLGISMSITFSFCSFCVRRWWASVSPVDLQSSAQCMDPSSVSAVTRTWWCVNASTHTCWFFYSMVTGVVSHQHSHIADNTVS